MDWRTRIKIEITGRRVRVTLRYGIAQHGSFYVSTVRYLAGDDKALELREVIRDDAEEGPADELAVRLSTELLTPLTLE